MRATALIAGFVTVVGLAAGAAAIDYTMYRMYAQALDLGTGVRDYLAHRTGVEPASGGGGSSSDPRTAAVTRDFTAQPMTLADKERYMNRLSAALPPAPEGWVVRAAVQDDLYALRPDYAHCAGKTAQRRALEADMNMMKADKAFKEGGQEAAMAAMAAQPKFCPPFQSIKGYVTYEKGQTLILLFVGYMRTYEDPPGPSAGMSFPLGRGLIAVEGHDLDHMQPTFSRHGFDFRQNQDISYGSAGHKLGYVAARRVEDGRVVVDATTNGSIATVKGLLMQLDYDLLNAMVAKPVG